MASSSSCSMPPWTGCAARTARRLGQRSAAKRGWVGGGVAPPGAASRRTGGVPWYARSRRGGVTVTSRTEPPTLLNITDVVSGPIPPRVVNLTWPNALHTRIRDVVAQAGPPPWSVRLFQDERNLVTLIANAPGTGNRPHWHKD